MRVGGWRARFGSNLRWLTAAAARSCRLLPASQELQALTRHAEKAVRALQQQQAAAGGGGGDAAFLRALAEAVDGFSSAVSYAIAVKQLMGAPWGLGPATYASGAGVVGCMAVHSLAARGGRNWHVLCAHPVCKRRPWPADDGKVPIGRLRQYAAGWLARVDAAQAGLRALLSGAIQARLAAAHWPPSLAVSGEGGAAAGPGGDPGAVFCGFEAAGGQVAAELTQLLTTLTTLQRAAQHERFAALGEASQEGPLLWAAEELAAPLAQRLRHHFAGVRRGHWGRMGCPLCGWVGLTAAVQPAVGLLWRRL